MNAIVKYEIVEGLCRKVHCFSHLKTWFIPCNLLPMEGEV